MRTLALLMLAGCAMPQAGGTMPRDVADYLARREACDHFRGEEPYDAERAAFLNRKLAETCTGADRDLAALKVRHRTNTAAMVRLNALDPLIE